MHKSTIMGLIGLAGFGALMAPYVAAQERPYFYGGLSAGQSQSQMDEQATVNNLLGYGVPITGTSRNLQDTGYRVFGGYQMNRNFALEGGYFSLGKFNFNTNTLTGPLNGEFEVEGINLDLVATAPLSERWSLLGRLGAQYANTRTAYSGTGLGFVAPGSRDKEESNLKVGVGLQYELSSSLFVRGEAERYRIHDAINTKGDINLFSLSLVVPFGRKGRRQAPIMSAVPYVAPAPMVAPAPAPTPMPIAVTPPAPVVAPLPRRIQFSADSLFSFDKAAMRPDGQAALDTFARDLKGARFNMITVEGNTDRLGSTAYNQKLSTLRAQAVKDYLSNTIGIDASRVSAVGKGESNPVTQPEDCKGNKATPALIACLQPDRRVDVEVTGER